MYQVSNDFNANAFAQTRELSGKVVINGSTTVTGQDIVSISLDQEFTDGLKTTLGHALSSSVKVVLRNTTASWNGAEIKPYIGVTNSSDVVEWCPLGVFYVSEYETIDDFGTVSLTAYDIMAYLDYAYTPTVTMPAWIKNVVTDISTQTGLSVDSSTTYPPRNIDNIYDNGGFVIPQTIRDTLAYVAGLMGKNVVINRDGEIAFRAFTTQSVTLSKSVQYMGGFRKDQDSAFTYSALVSGTEENQITSGSGNAIAYLNPFMKQEYLDLIRNSTLPITVMPGSIKYRCDPQLDVGDIVSVEDHDGTTYNFLITTNKIVYNGGMNATVTCDAFTDEENALNAVGDTALKNLIKEQATLAVKYLSADHITAGTLGVGVVYGGTVNANQVNITDVSDFNATLGGLHLTSDKIYSGSKTSPTDNNNGLYMDDDGQLALKGDTGSLKFYDDNGSRNLEVVADSLYIGSSDVSGYDKVATNYLASDSTGIMVAELNGSAETPSTATGNNVRITSTTVDVRNGQNTLASMGQSGMTIYNGSGTQIANLGYGSGTSSGGGTANAPYYDLGVRVSNSTKGNYSTVEGWGNTASGYASHAEGNRTVASGTYSHAEGGGGTPGDAGPVASALAAHAEGVGTTASGPESHAEGLYTVASGAGSHAQGAHTETSENWSTVLGKYNSTTSGYAVVVGGGTSTSAKADILKLDWSGNVTASGDITASGDVTGNGVALSGALQKSGGTMTGQLLTSYRTSVAMGSYGSSQSTVDGLAGEVRFSSGCMGSANITTAYTKNGTTIPTGWYNFIYSPHRSGGNSGSASGDNCNYGTLILSSMTANADTYVIRISTGTIQRVGKIAWQNRAYYDGNASGVTDFWNSSITTHQDGYLEREGNIVYAYLRFSAPSTSTSGQAICTIPSGYRPNHVCHFTTTRAWAVQATAPVSVSATSGVVAFINTAYATSANYILCATWITDEAFPV